LTECTPAIRVETSENAAGNTGFDEVAVTPEKSEILGSDSEEADVFSPTVSLCFFLDLAERFA